MVKSYSVYCRIDGMTAVFSMRAINILTALLLIKANFNDIEGAVLAVVD